MSRIILLAFFLVITLGSCTTPFFISQKERDERDAKRVERLEKKKKKVQYKVDASKRDNKRKIKKLEKIDNKLPGDSIIVGLDSASLAREKEEITKISLLKKTREDARAVIERNQINFKTAKLKIKMKVLADGKKQSFNAHFIIEKDTAIWVTIRVGLEVARAYITPHRVQAINKISKVYYDFTFDEIVKLINVNIDFATLQDAIMGNAMGANGEIFELTDFGGTINIGVKSEEFLNKLTYNRSDSSLRQIQLQVFRGSYASNILGMLGEYQKELGRMIATKRVYNIEDSKGKLSLELEVQKADFDGEYRMPFEIPTGYKKVE